jgi:hypothetical protein
LQHAKAGLRDETLTETQKANSNKLISYLEELGNTAPQQTHIVLDPTEKEKYLGDYMYGDEVNDGFSIKLNRRKLLTLGKLGEFGGAIYQQSDGVFEYNGISSVKISFEKKEGNIVSLTVNEPNLQLKAAKV